MKKIVLAYSGGLDTSCAIKWLKDKGYEVIAFIADVGQRENFDDIDKRALDTGATKVYVIDLQKEFVTDYVFPSICVGTPFTKSISIYVGLSGAFCGLTVI